MHIVNIFDELGPFTTLSQLYMLDYLQIDSELKGYFPLPDEKVFFDILQTTRTEITKIGELAEKTNVIIAGPELVLLEAFGQTEKEMYVAVDAEINPDICQRISRNVPPNTNVNFFQIPRIPEELNSDNSLMIVASFPDKNNQAWVTLATYRIICYYRQYYSGNIYFVHPQQEGFEADRFSDKWVLINKEQFATK